ncbi:lamin tail domain-containing protein [Pedobacter agri]|uniref:Lamin tail domain-containing protein n=1 Tax=Pedobacter agri TaxID=454586 RepID=A0A9X3DED4_9SPHI|nr:lamin tail domain-containing protein [Pedobacter agri]MCX3266102.1 lamin tail domain-containing protein [Pedobacter agri]
MVKITLISLLLPIKIASIIFTPSIETRKETGGICTSSPISFCYNFFEIKNQKVRPALKIISKGDILISEVLFNPRTGGVDFVEIYNNSGHDIDLKELQLANANTAGEPANIKNVSSAKLMIAPGSYWVITTNQANIKLNYQVKFPNQFAQISSLPAFNNDKGSVILLSNNQVLDRLNYNAKIHHPLIQDEDGISLERVSFSLDSNEPGNFRSAAATVGFATPTYKNSQEKSGNENYARLVSKTFSPDGDRFEDVMTLEYQLDQPASLATVNIYSDKGQLVKRLLKNQTIGTNGNLTWDGLDEQGQKAAIGIYIILFDVFDLNGNTKRFKNTCVLAGKLN